MGALLYYTGDMNIGSLNSENLGISNEAANLPKGIINIALFGIDSRSRDAHNRTESLSGLSDTIIILSINTISGSVKLTSLLRDSWVYIDGGKKFKGYDKLNAAYSHGGPELAIKTINTHFGLNVSNYVALSLLQLQRVIDIMGGIDIHITEAERVALNGLANSEGYNVKPLYKTGLVHLDGGQAMMYSRIRKIDSEGHRVLRQQKVLNCLFEKAKQLPVSQYPGLLKQILQYVETSLSYDEIWSLSPMLSKDIKLQNKSIPGDEIIAEGGVFEDTRGGWVWKYDLNEAKNYIIDWIYDKN
jgi:LCP family protein required for cell wall assembly